MSENKQSIFVTVFHIWLIAIVSVFGIFVLFLTVVMVMACPWTIAGLILMMFIYRHRDPFHVLAKTMGVMTVLGLALLFPWAAVIGVAVWYCIRQIHHDDAMIQSHRR